MSDPSATTPTTAAPATPPTQVDLVASWLRDDILTGRRTPGENLREVELARRHEVSRHTLRAALRQLASEGLVRIDANRGARVIQLDGDELRALFELRTALEVEAARLLHERRGFDPWPVEVEQASLALQRACTRAVPDAVVIDQAHAELHHAIVAAAESPRITAVHESLTAVNRAVLLQSRIALPPPQMAALHRDLLVDLRAIGPDALRSHLAAGAFAAATPAPVTPPDHQTAPDPR